MTKREKHVSGAPRRNFYGRIKGKSLQKSQERYMTEDPVSYTHLTLPTTD